MMDAKYLAEIKVREQAVTNNPVRYYKDGRPFVQFAATVIEDHPIVECLARLDRYEKYIIPSKDQQIDELTEKLKKTAALGTKWADEILLKDEQIATLEKALKLAVESSQNAFIQLANAGVLTIKHIGSVQENFKYWIQQAQEQEADHA